MSLAGPKWIRKYLREYGMNMEDFKAVECYQIFKFGLIKQYVSKRMIELPIVVTSMEGKEKVMLVNTYVVEADVPFLCGKIYWKNGRPR